MKDLLERIKAFNRKPTELDIEDLISEIDGSFNGEPSIELLEEVIKYYKAARKKILTGDLLEWMQENDLTVLETDDFKVTIQTYVSAKVEDSDIAFMWLEENEYGDLIKDTLDLARGEFTEEVAEAFRSLGVSYTKKSGIHPQALKKVMSDRLKAEEDLPSEDEGFKINYYDECNVKEL